MAIPLIQTPHTLSNPYYPDYNGQIKLPAFGGADIVTTFYIKGNVINTYNIATLSIDATRGVAPIHTLGSTNTRKFVRGHRTIAGSIVFLTTTDGPIPLYGVNSVFPEAYGEHKEFNTSPMLDQLPPFDISISYMDEYGRMSFEKLFGVVIYRVSKTHSISDLVTEVICQYLCLDMDPQMSNVREGQWDVTGKVDNIIVFNNISALTYEQNNIKYIIDRLEQSTYSDGDKISYTPITNAELALSGPRITEIYISSASDILLSKMRSELNKYTIAINYLKSLPYDPSSGIYNPDERVETINNGTSPYNY